MTILRADRLLHQLCLLAKKKIENFRVSPASLDVCVVNSIQQREIYRRKFLSSLIESAPKQHGHGFLRPKPTDSFATGLHTSLRPEGARPTSI